MFGIGLQEILILGAIVLVLLLPVVVVVAVLCAKIRRG